MGFSFVEKTTRQPHPKALRMFSLPSANLLTDPLAPVKSVIPRHSFSERPFHGMFQERLEGPLASLPPVKSPKLGRRKERMKRESRSVKTTRGSSFVTPSTNKENCEVKEAFGRAPSEGSWSGDLIRLSSALDQLAALCNRPPGLPRSPDPYHHHTVNNNNIKNALHKTSSMGIYGGSPQHCHRNSSFKSQPDNFYAQLFETAERDWGLTRTHSNPSSGPRVGGDEPRGVTRKMGIVLKALGDKLSAWGKGEGAIIAQLNSHTSLDQGRTTVPDLIPNPFSNSQTTSTPPMQPNGTIMTRKVVVALYDYNAAQIGDLSLRKNEEFEILDDSEDHWWKMRDSQGREGYAPSNYVREKGNLGLQQYDWYLGDATRQRAEAILLREEKEGCFVVRNSTTNSGIYTLSVFSKMSRVQVKHYHIKTDPDGMYFLSNSIKCVTIPELIYRHQHNPGGLCTRLRSPPSQLRQAPTTAGLSHDKWEVVPSELNLLEELGSGQFGVVRHGKLYGMDVAVKMMKEGTMSEDEFIEEAKVMTKLQHPNLVQLYGVCRRKRPIYIVTEYLKHGSLLNYLRTKEKVIIQKTDTLLDMCSQVCEGMAYLEGQKFIHRDLAARNCLVGSNNVIKVGDFGLARYVVDDEYTGSGGAKFPIKWAAPEVLNYMRFSSKSDVWAFSVLIWEVFTCGKMPYGRHKNAEVVELVQQGKILDRPRHCPTDVYEIMRKGWTHSQEQRPGFQDIKVDILRVVKSMAD